LGNELLKPELEPRKKILTCDPSHCGHFDLAIGPAQVVERSKTQMLYTMNVCQALLGWGLTY